MSWEKNNSIKVKLKGLLGSPGYRFGRNQLRKIRRQYWKKPDHQDPEKKTSKENALNLTKNRFKK